jgi:hypothetical protein
VAHEQAPGVGEVDPPRPARPVDEPPADRPLEVGDLLAHGGLRIAELACRGPEGARPPDGLERREVAQLDTEESITFIHRIEL